MSNSPLATYTRITKNKTSPRNHAIDTITIHCIVGQWTAKQGCDYFATTDRQCSANYVVGKDGSIGPSVDEKVVLGVPATAPMTTGQSPLKLLPTPPTLTPSPPRLMRPCWIW